MICAVSKRLLLACLFLTAVPARSQSVAPLPPETVLVSGVGAPIATEYSFSIANSQDLTLTLTDSQVPAPMSSATVVVTQGGAIIGSQASPGSATLAPPATSATVSIPGASGAYTVRVFGVPNPAFSVGTFTVCVAPKADPSACIQSASTAGNITASGSSSNPAVSTVSASLTVATSGSYTVTFADDSFPAPLAVAPTLAIFQGSAPISLNIASGSAVPLNPGTYTLLAVAQADATTQAGVYGINISGPQTLLNASYAVGKMQTPAPRNNAIAATLTLKVTDFAFPAALGRASALVTAGAAPLGSATAGASGSTSFSSPAGGVQIWTYTAAGSDAGTYEIDLTSATAGIAQIAGGIANGNSLAYAFVTSSLSAGAYQANVSDFQFPSALQGVKFAVAQNDALLGSPASAAGSLDFTAAGGPVVLLIDATTPATGNGVFDVNVTPSGSTTIQFDQTQAVSVNGLFDNQIINTGTAGSYDITLTDLDFPAPFKDLALLVSSGGTILGKIYGGGTFSINATPGSYQLTFVATPAAQQSYGMYGLSIVNSAPTVTLSASPTTVATNATTTLSWTTTNASACTASGGTFIGPQSAGTGSLAVVVSATTSYSLTCTGTGGSATGMVTVTATPAAPASTSGGGGGIGGADLGALGLLTVYALLRRWRRELQGALG